MVSIDTVYQTVLALANKEQRGYITPQEFNLYANTAQFEIIEQYFYDINQFERTVKNSTEYSQVIHLIREKLAVLEYETTYGGTNSKFQIPADLYKLGTLSITRAADAAVIEAEYINPKDLYQINQSNLTKPTLDRPVFRDYIDRQDHVYQVYPKYSGEITLNYIKIPKRPNWGFTIVGERALLNPSRTQDFELHYAELPELVHKILTLAGVTMNKQEVIQTASALQNNKIQQEKQ
tara:strand:- start:13691 stop:14398 length:708 start_codon:yes stop_codon:yes gene_type:complete